MLKKAVIIGINEYRDPKLARLHGAENDAEEIRRQLMEFGEFEVADDAFLTGAQATSAAIRNAISDLLYPMDQKDVSLVYFSGHGFPDAYGEGYIAAHDVECARPWVHGLRMKDLRELLLRSNHKAGILILDCCYSGIAADGEKGSDDKVDLSRQFSEAETEIAGAGRIIIASSGKDQKSRERSDCVHGITGGSPHCHGLFTYHLLEGLDGGAANDAVNGRVDLGSLITYVGSKMDKSAGPRFYASSLQNANEIVILNTSRVSSQREPLEMVREALQKGDVAPRLWELCNQLHRVLKVAPKLDDATALRCRLESEIEAHRRDLFGYFEKNYRAFLGAKITPQILFDRRKLIIDLNFESLTAMEDGPSLIYLDDLYRAQRGEMTVAWYCETLKLAGPPKESEPPALNRAPLVQGSGLSEPGP